MAGSSGAPPVQVADLDEPGWLLATAPRRRALAAVLSFVVLAVGMWNVPVPGLRPAYRELTAPAYRLVGLDQSWSYFAPDVVLRSPDVWIEVDDLDGRTERLDLPSDFPVFGTLRRYRWIKFDQLVAYDGVYETVLDHAERIAPDPGSLASVHVVVAWTSPTTGPSGPYELVWGPPTRVASRQVAP